MHDVLVALVASMAPTFAIVANYILSHRTKTIASNNTAALADIHLLVNSRLTQALERIIGLEKALGIVAGAPVPTEGPSA